MKFSKIYQNILLESSISGKTLIVVDVQPIYFDGFNHWFEEFVEFLNENNDQIRRIIFLYNGEETVGTISEHEYQMWWFENQLKEEIIYNSLFYDKGYAFFRFCIDEGIDKDSIVNLVKFMVQKDINDSRDMTEEFWNEFIEDYGDEDIRGLLELADDMISIPDLMDFLQNYDNIILCGGGVDECLKEVEIALMVLEKPYDVLDEFTY